MTEFTRNIAMQQQVYTMPQSQPIKTLSGQIMYMPPERTLRDEFVHQHKKNGLFERLYNALKNVTKLGTGSKKTQTAIEKAEKGEITEEQARETIQKYRNSQVSSTQAFTDVLSVGASGITFFGIRNYLKKVAAAAIINESIISNVKHFGYNCSAFFNDKQCLNFAKNKGKIGLLATGAAMLAGALAKWGSSKLNRIGSKEFKIDKKEYNNLATPMDETMYKMDRKNLRKARRRANFRNFVGGAINGLMMPIALLGGGIVGTPIYLVGNSLSRYFVSNHEEKDKTFNSYIENLKNGGITHVATAAAIAVPMVKKARFTATMDANLQKAVNRLKNVTLKPNEFKGISTYQELDDILMDSDSIKNIVNNDSLSIEDKVKKLSEGNIFAVKFKQIKNDGSDLAYALKEDCPPTRCFLKSDGKWDLTEIQSFVNKNLEGNYQVKQCLGVGTVAETYLAVGPDGKEVCLKVLKKGIDEAKIKADKAKFVDIIKKLDSAKYSQEQKDYLIKNIDDLADGILKEVNFSHEAEAAKRLVESTKVANVVKPIKVHNNIYIMEKARGISLQSLMDLNTAYRLKDLIKKEPEMANFVCFCTPKGSKLGKLLKDKKGDEVTEIIDKFIMKVESRTPGLDKGKLTKDDYSFMLDEYAQLIIEQFNKIDKNGKVLHADIHPGNIFIDIEALKNRRKIPFVDGAKAHLGYRTPGKIFTLIDTGNVVKQTIEESIDSINLTSYIERGNYKDIARYVTKGAKGALSEEKMSDIVEKELKNLFTNETTELGHVTTESLLEITSNIMRKHGVMPANTQLNLKKAQTSAMNSLEGLFNESFYLTVENLDPSSQIDRAKAATKLTTELLSFMNKIKQMTSQQEKLNLLQMSKDQVKKFKKNPNMAAKNSEEYLFYKLKQQKLCY